MKLTAIDACRLIIRGCLLVIIIALFASITPGPATFSTPEYAEARSHHFSGDLFLDGGKLAGSSRVVKDYNPPRDICQDPSHPWI